MDPISGSQARSGCGIMPNVALPVQDAGDVAHRAVGIVDVAERHAVFGFEFIERALVGEIVAFAVGDGQLQDLAFAQLRGERRVRGFGAQRRPRGR